MSFQKITESESHYNDLEKMSALELVTCINKEDATVAAAVQKQLPIIADLIENIAQKMINRNGRLFYIGAGTSGRLGVVDASECPPTYGVPYGLVVAIIAGGNKAITEAVEFAEDSNEQGWQDLLAHDIDVDDVVIGIAASGTTPYVISALKKCREMGITTGSITCNPGAPISAESDFPIEVVVGPEFVTGSTRMKSGTAQKMVLNMISTAVMVKLGRVEGNKMVNMQLANEKLVDRGVKMLMSEMGWTDYEQAKAELLKHGSVKKAIINNRS